MSAATEHPCVEPVVTVWLNRIQAEYREMPGLSLTQAQMQRLWGLEAHVCQVLIGSLVAARVLRPTETGRFISYDG